MSDPENQSPEVEADNFATQRLDDPEGGGRLTSDAPLPREAVEADRAQAEKHPPTSPGATDGDPTSPGFLIGLARWRPFMAFFHFIADSLFPKSMPGHEQIRGCRVVHPRLYKACLVGDFSVVLFLVGFLGWIAIRIACNAFA